MQPSRAINNVFDEYLGYRTFDEEARFLFEDHLRSRVAQGALPEDLMNSGLDILRLWRIIPPADTTIHRIAASIAAAGREETFRRIASHLDDATRQALERVLDKRRAAPVHAISVPRVPAGGDTHFFG
jgi:hypothetical protein